MSRAPSPTAGDVAPPRAPAGPVAWTALLASLVALGLGAMAAFRGGSAGSASTGGSSDLDERLAAQARTLREEIQDDFRRQVGKAEDTLARADRKLEESQAMLSKMVDDSKRVAENAVRSSADTADAVDGKLREVTDSAGKLRGTVDALAATVKVLESRPVAVAAAPRTPSVGESGKPPVKPPDGDPVPAGPSAEQIAANKEKVSRWIADLSSPDTSKAFTACASLGAAGDLAAVESLVKALKEHKDSMVRTAAASALGSLHACDGVLPLIQAFLDKDDGVVLAAGVAVGKIIGQDTGLTGTPTRREKTDARDKWTKWWSEHETEVRTRWNQPKGAPPAPSGPDAPK